MINGVTDVEECFDKIFVLQRICWKILPILYYRNIYEFDILAHFGMIFFVWHFYLLEILYMITMYLKIPQNTFLQMILLYVRLKERHTKRVKKCNSKNLVKFASATKVSKRRHLSADLSNVAWKFPVDTVLKIILLLYISRGKLVVLQTGSLVSERLLN